MLQNLEKKGLENGKCNKLIEKKDPFQNITMNYDSE